MNRNLRLLWTGQLVSHVGDALLSAVLVFLALSLGPDETSGRRAGFVQLAATLPFLLFSAAAGGLADRLDRRRVMIGSDLARAAILGSVPLLWWCGLLSWPVLAAAAFANFTLSTAFGPAQEALIPDIAEGRPLLRVNALFQTSIQVAMVAGMLLAAAFLGIGGQGGGTIGLMVALIGIDAVSFLVSALCIAAIRPPERTLEPLPGAGPAHIGDVLRRPLFQVLLGLTAVDNLFIMGPAIVGSALLLRRTFGLGAGHLALFEACLAGGWFAGSLMVSRLGHGWPRGWTILAGMLLDGLTYVPFYWIRSYPLLCVAVFVHGLTIPLITVPRTALVQERIPAELRARAFSLVQLTVRGCTALSVFLTGILGDLIPAPALFLYAGIGAMVGLAGVFSRELREAR